MADPIAVDSLLSPSPLTGNPPPGLKYSPAAMGKMDDIRVQTLQAELEQETDPNNRAMITKELVNMGATPSGKSPTSTKTSGKGNSVDLANLVSPDPAVSGPAAAKISDPALAAVPGGPAELANFITAANTVSATATANTATANLDAAKQQSAQTQLMADLQAHNALQESIYGTQADKDYKTYQASQDLASHLGVNPNDLSTYLLNQKGDELRAAVGNASTEHQKLINAESMSFGDDPVTWLWNQFAMKDQRERVSDADKQVESIKAQASALASNADSGQAEVTKYSGELTQKYFDDQARIKVLTDDAKLQVAAIDSWGKGIDTIEKLNRMNMSSLQAMAETLNQKRDADRFEFQKAEFRQREEDRQQKLAVDATMASNVTRGLVAMGFSDRASHPVTPLELAAAERLKGREWELFQLAANTGEASISRMSQGDSESRPIAGSPGAYAAMVDKYNIPGSSTTMHDGINKIVMEARRTAQASGINPKNEADVIEKTNLILGEEYKKWNVNAESTGSPIAVTSLQKALAGDKELTNTKFYRDVLAPGPIASGEGKSKFTADRLTDIAANAIVNGQTTVEDASAWISTFYMKNYHKAMVDNNFAGIGLDPIKGYRAPITIGMFGSGPQQGGTYEMANASQVAALLNRKLLWGSRGNEASKEE